ncbi:MAG: VWA domain-containing protein [Glaciecola sp.]|jgi:Ca-activated chloride channel family protein
MIDWQAFHFIRPEWLYAIIPLLFIAFLLSKVNAKKSGWQGLVSSHLYQHLVISKDKKASKPPFFLLAFAWILASVAMAGPTWEKLPQPVYQVETGKVVILDMSMSMRATDLKPDRLSIAKFKTIDLLNMLDDGEVGLVVYAGDAFTVSPLTADPSNITALVPSLRPEIMPIPGSVPIIAFETAEQLLASAGYTKGEIYWISDGIDPEDVEELREFVSRSPYRYSALGVGTKVGAPIKLLDGGFLKDTRGNIVLPSLQSDLFNQVIGNTAGRYTPVQINDSDIENMLLSPLVLDQDQVNNDIIGEGDQWQDMGAFVILLILPFALLAFRKGLLVVTLAFTFMLPSEQVFAQQWYDKVFKNADQQGLDSYQNEDYETASQLFKNQMWKGAALYKQQNYEAALEAFQQVPGAESHYNQGNTLAKIGQLQDAIAQYEKALALHPGHANAMANKKLIEELLEQQEQQENQDSESSEQDSSGEQNQQEQQDGQQQDGEQSQNGEQNQQQDQGSEQDQDQEQESESQQSGNNGEPKDEQGQEQAESTEEQQNEQEQNAQQAGEEAENEKPEEQQAAVQQVSEEDMTPEQREQMQRMQMLMNKVPDDPAYLLQRKMLLESQQRRRERLNRPNKKDW